MVVLAFVRNIVKLDQSSQGMIPLSDQIIQHLVFSIGFSEPRHLRNVRFHQILNAVTPQFPQPISR